jgi:hypothetical protein
MRCLKTESLIHGTGAALTTHTIFACTGSGAARKMLVESSFSVIPFVALVTPVIKFVTALSLNNAYTLPKLLLSVMDVIRP